MQFSANQIRKYAARGVVAALLLMQAAGLLIPASVFGERLQTVRRTLEFWFHATGDFRFYAPDKSWDGRFLLTDLTIFREGQWENEGLSGDAIGMGGQRESLVAALFLQESRNPNSDRLQQIMRVFADQNPQARELCIGAAWYETASVADHRDLQIVPVAKKCIYP